MTREDLIDIFEDTKNTYETNEFLQEAIKETIKNTAFYAENDTPTLPKKRFEGTKITVTKYRSLESAYYYRCKNPKLRIGIHNFASATNPGGGVRKGSRAQEEALCRCTTLYPALNTDENFKRYYKFHRDRQDSVYTDACIYTPNIIAFKADTQFCEKLQEKEWQKFDVLTCAAPNLRIYPNNEMNPGNMKRANVSDDELKKIHIKRAKHILSVAANHNIDIMILGAFGCGAFRNDPNIVAAAYKTVLSEFDGYFKEISFAIFCSPREQTNYDAFYKMFNTISR